MAYGQLGWTEERLLDTDLRVFELALKGFNKLEEQRQREEWERLRILGVWVLSPHTKKGQNLTPKKLLPFPWDKSFVEENKELLELAKKIGKEHG